MSTSPETRVAILGAGTLAAFILDILARMSPGITVRLYDDGFPEVHERHGVSILGRLHEAPRDWKLVIGIGDPVKRKSLYEHYAAQGCAFCSIVDPSCILSRTAKIADGVVIGPLSSVLSGSTIGEGACILSHVNVNQNVGIGPFALIGAGAVLGNNVRVGIGAHVGLGARIPLGGHVDDWADA